RWWISGLLLLATMINYMDRQTLANLSVRITEQFKLSQEQYGDIEFVFGLAFAMGAIFFGMIADRVSVRWLYPGVLIAWSMMGFATGFTHGYTAMLICRTLLGFFEAGHWPCAMIIMHRVMIRKDRVMGNSILQSGASLGAIITPLIIRFIVGNDDSPDAWRPPFLIIGGVGILWAVLWFAVVRRGDLERGHLHQPEADLPPQPHQNSEKPWGWLIEFFRSPRFWALFITVIAINISWQLIRAWLPKFLQQGRQYSEAEALYFNSVYYISTDVGCLLAGAFSLWLTRRGVGILNARLIVFGLCAALTSLTTVAAFLPRGWPLLAVLLLVAAGSLGLFPCYYAFVQELNSKHVGKTSGVLGCSAWLVSAPLQKMFGRLVDQTGSFDLGLSLVGWAPMLGFLALLCLWRRGEQD
ncbi:MAG: MFS transporter, partial [Pirellulaceae bacterium]|nr:MFS transporter [Pirellulaceae bacterium]